MRKLGQLVHERGGATPSKDRLDYWTGEIPWVSPKDMKTSLLNDSIDHVSTRAVAETSLQLIPAGSVLMVVRGMILAHSVPVALTTAPVTINQDMKALVPAGDVSGLYLRYSLQAHRDPLLALVEEAGHGTRCLRSELWRRFEVPVPPLPTQQAIADFLDRKTAGLDALIEKKQALLDRLAEKRTALINQAVTKGLDPTVPMKDSGVPWIGEIAAHWEVKPLRLHARVVDCKHRTPTYVDEGYPIVSTTEVKPGRLDLTGVNRRVGAQDFEEMTEGRRPLRGDIIYSRNASLGAAAYVDTDEAFAMGQDVVLIAGDHSLLYLSYLLNSPVGMTQVDLACVGATFKRINVGQIKQFQLCVPPAEEAARIAAHIDTESQDLLALQRAITTQITRLQEYRQALITAAVTGQLELP
jgi:type I restriction enzyme S subunit